MKKYSGIVILGLVVAFILEIILVWCFGQRNCTLLEELAWSGESITGVVAITALISFFYQVIRDRDLSATDLIAFFREKIIVEKNEFDLKVNSTNGSIYKFQEHWIELEKFELWWLRLHHRSLADKQLEIYKKNSALESEVLKLFNLLEEFSLKVKYMGLINHPALSSVRAAYISIIEENSNFILTYVLYAPKGYPGIRELYQAWKKYGERDSAETRLEKAKLHVVEQIKLEKKRIEKEKSRK